MWRNCRIYVWSVLLTIVLGPNSTMAQCGTCTISGDAHYVTLDGAEHHYYGRGWHRLFQIDRFELQCLLVDCRDAKETLMGHMLRNGRDRQCYQSCRARFTPPDKSCPQIATWEPLAIDGDGLSAVSVNEVPLDAARSVNLRSRNATGPSSWALRIARVGKDAIAFDLMMGGYAGIVARLGPKRIVTLTVRGVTGGSGLCGSCDGLASNDLAGATRLNISDVAGHDRFASMHIRGAPGFTLIPKKPECAGGKSVDEKAAMARLRREEVTRKENAESTRSRNEGLRALGAPLPPGEDAESVQPFPGVAICSNHTVLSNVVKDCHAGMIVSPTSPDPRMLFAIDSCVLDKANGRGYELAAASNVVAYVQSLMADQQGELAMRELKKSGKFCAMCQSQIQTFIVDTKQILKHSVANRTKVGDPGAAYYSPFEPAPFEPEPSEGPTPSPTLFPVVDFPTIPVVPQNMVMTAPPFPKATNPFPLNSKGSPIRSDNVVAPVVVTPAPLVAPQSVMSVPTMSPGMADVLEKGTFNNDKPSESKTGGSKKLASSGESGSYHLKSGGAPKPSMKQSSSGNRKLPAESSKQRMSDNGGIVDDPVPVSSSSSAKRHRPITTPTAHPQTLPPILPGSQPSFQYKNTTTTSAKPASDFNGTSFAPSFTVSSTPSLLSLRGSSGAERETPEDTPPADEVAAPSMEETMGISSLTYSTSEPATQQYSPAPTISQPISAPNSSSSLIEGSVPMASNGSLIKARSVVSAAVPSTLPRTTSLTPTRILESSSVLAVQPPGLASPSVQEPSSVLAVQAPPGLASISVDVVTPQPTAAPTRWTPAMLPLPAAIAPQVPVIQPAEPAPLPLLSTEQPLGVDIDIPSNVSVPTVEAPDNVADVPGIAPPSRVILWDPELSAGMAEAPVAALKANANETSSNVPVNNQTSAGDEYCLDDDPGPRYIQKRPHRTRYKRRRRPQQPL